MKEEKAEVVLDTNVAVVANGKAEQAGSKCVTACRDKLRQIQEGRLILLLDDKRLIMEEYRKNLNPSGQPGYGDRFFKWLWYAHMQHCRIVRVTSNDIREFEEFPDNPDLAAFDRDDRKFVAVALASGSNPKILNAVDTDWWVHREALRRQGVEVAFLCPELMSNGRP